MPWQVKHETGQHDSSKIKALQSMVAEQLLALEAASKGIGKDSLTQMHTKALERLMVRDELFKREVKSKIKVTDQESKQALKRYAWTLKVLLLGTRSKVDAASLAEALSDTSDIATVLSRYPLSFFTQVDTMTVNFGGLDEKLEDAAYALDFRHRVSDPVDSPYFGWVVLYLVNREANPEYAKRSVQDRWRVIGRQLRERKESQRASAYTGTVLASKRAEARPEAFDLFARTIYGVLAADSSQYRKSGGYRLDPIIDTLVALLWPHLNDELVTMEGGGMTIGDVLESYRNQQFLFPNLNEEDFRLRLNNTVKDIVASEILAREAYRQKVEHSDQVKHDVGVWTNYWLAMALERQVVHSVRASDEEVLDYLTENGGMLGKDYEVNIREILSDSLQQALSLLERLNDGADMAELARQFSKRSGWSQRGGVSGFFRVSAYPQIGFRALEQDTGKVVGPVPVPNGYSIFTVLGKRTVVSDSVLSYDSLKTLARVAVESQKMKRDLNRYVASIYKKYNVSIHYDKLPKVQIMPANMFTKRFIGFGGVMTAVPLLYPLWEWARDVEKPEKILP
jgi:parvulin-like peptidyl-prolyl isomerase